MKVIHILESQKKNLLESSGDEYDYIYASREGDDITDAIKNYFSYSVYGEKDPMFSKIASKIHDALMFSLCLHHERTEDRKRFASILSYLKILFSKVEIKNIEIGYNYDWYVNLANKDNDLDCRYIIIDKEDFEDDDKAYRYAIVFKTQDGINHISTDYRPGSINGSCGYYTDKAEMDDEMKQKIIGMGLVPAIVESGSYHENWLYSVGILPQYVSKLKKAQDESMWGKSIFFDCKFGV